MTSGKDKAADRSRGRSRTEPSSDLDGAEIRVAGDQDASDRAAQSDAAAFSAPRCALESIALSQGGGVFINGWADDGSSRLLRILIEFEGAGSLTIDAGQLARSRRPDVEQALGASIPYAYGFWGFAQAGVALAGQRCQVSLQLADGTQWSFAVQARVSDEVSLRDQVLAHLAAAEYFGNQQIGPMISIGHWLGVELVKFNRRISQAICAKPYVEHFGEPTRPLKGSIIVCLYGKHEYLFLQNALYSGLPGIEDYEFIYVCNSPELAERLLDEARIAQTVYGGVHTLVLLPGNAGFGAANNLAARYARSNRLLIVNPDVFPHDRDWARKHSEVVEQRPREQTALFGVPLYYDDGSLMHGGMYFEIDTLPSVNGLTMVRHDFVRVEHYGKGAPPQTVAFRQSRAVPAVTGAFMSLARSHFEQLGGFTEDFIFGHYEDADLCLKSLMAGTPAWIHDIGLWHLEGKGSTRKPVHEGGSTVNRWLFTTSWGGLIKERLNGPRVDLASFGGGDDSAIIFGAAQP